MFAGFTRPSAVLKTTRSPSQSIQLIVNWGMPSLPTVPTTAKFLPLEKARLLFVNPATEVA